MTEESSTSIDGADRSLIAVIPSPRLFNTRPSILNLLPITGRSLLGFDPVAVYSFLIFNAFVFYLIYIAIADRKDRLHRKRQAQLLREKLSHRLDKELLAVLPDDQLHKAVIHLRKTEFKLKYGQLHHDQHHHHHPQVNNMTQQDAMAMLTSTTAKPMTEPESLAELPTPFVMEKSTQSPIIAGTSNRIMAFASPPVTSSGSDTMPPQIHMVPWQYAAFQPSLAVQQGWSSLENEAHWEKLRHIGNSAVAITNNQRADPVNANRGQLPGVSPKYGMIVLRHRGANNHELD